MPSWAKCPECGEMIELKLYKKHVLAHGRAKDLPKSKSSLYFSDKSHKEVVKFLAEHPNKIEEGMTILFRELPIYRGRIDLVGRDKNMKICLIEVVHRSNQPREYWKKRLEIYRAHLRRMGQLIFHEPSLEVRLLLVKRNFNVEQLYP